MQYSTKQAMTDLVLIMYNNGQFQEFEAGSILGQVKQEAMGPHISMIFPKSVVGPIVSTVKAALEKGAVHMVKYNLNVNKKEETFQAKAIPMHLNCALLIIQNITEQEEIKKELYQKNKLLQTVIDTITTEITAFDKEGNIALRNTASSTNNRYTTVEQYFEENKVNLKSDGTTPYTEDDLPLRIALQGETVVDQIVVKPGEDHSYKTYLVNAIALADDQEQSAGIVLTERDMSDLKEVQLKLKSKIKDFDMFMYRASHDLKSPIAAMKGVLNLACERVKDPESRVYLEMVRKSHTLLSVVIDDLISLTRISQREIRKSPVQLSSLTQRVIDKIKVLPQCQELIIKVEVPDYCVIYTDEDLLKTALQNIICNAVIHHRSEGKDRFVEIKVFDQAKATAFEISDNGSGIPDNIQDKIYDIFFRGNLKASGSGLGLFVVKQVIEKLGGNIKLISKEGFGSSFSITIPKTQCT